MSAPANELVTTKEMDYLDEDKPIRGQNYVCLSFLSPEDVLKDKEVFIVEKYLDAFTGELKTLFDNLRQKYPGEVDLLQGVQEANSQFFDPNRILDHYRFFRAEQGDVLEREYHEKNNFRTSTRGIKVRGVFETLPEAQKRAELLKKMGDKFDIFVAQVGCWCPWSPNPEHLQDQEYAETQLNTLMKKYKENMVLRDQFFEERKQEKIRTAQEAVASAKPMVVEDSLLAQDPWTARKEEESTEKS
jgi:hypothetical protein